MFSRLNALLGRSLDEGKPSSCGIASPDSRRSSASVPSSPLRMPGASPASSPETRVRKHRSRSCLIMPQSVDFTGWFNCPDHGDVLLHITAHSPDPPPSLSPETAPSLPSPSSSYASLASDHLYHHGHHDGGHPHDLHNGLHHSNTSNTSPTDLQVRTYHAHALLLDSQSSYFRARLSNCWNPQPQHLSPFDSQLLNSYTTAGPTGHRAARCRARYELVEHVLVEELEATDWLLRLFYGHTLPDSTPAPLAFQCLGLADRFGAPACMDHLASHLAFMAENPESTAVDNEFLRLTFSAPPTVMSRPAFQHLLELCKRSLVRLFGNLPCVARSEELRQQFCSLPFAAVLAWAQSDELLMHSESCVVFMLSSWVTHQESEGQSATPEQLEQLAHQVRVFHLGPAYLHHVLPHLPWFRGCSGMAHLPCLLSYKTHGVNIGVGLTSAYMSIAGRRQLTTVCWEGPPAWMAPPRRRCSGADEPLMWSLSASALQQLGSGPDGAVVSPTAFYAQGLWLQVVLQADPGDPSPAAPAVANPGIAKCTSAAGVSSPSVTPRATAAGPTLSTLSTLSSSSSSSSAHGAQMLDLRFCIDVEAMARSGIPWPASGVVLLSPVEVRINGNSAATHRQRSYSRARFLAGTCSRPYRDILTQAAPRAQDLVAAYVREGGMLVQAKLTVDEMLR